MHINYQHILLLLVTATLLLTACDDDDQPANNPVEITPAEPNTVTFSFGDEDVTFTETEIEGSALVDEANPNQVQKLVISAERTPENQDGYALCIEINDTNVQPDTYPVQRDSANGAARLLMIEVDAQQQQLTSFTPTGDGTLNLETFNSSTNTVTGNFISDFQNDAQTILDVTGAFNLTVFETDGFEDTGNCAL